VHKLVREIASQQDECGNEPGNRKQRIDKIPSFSSKTKKRDNKSAYARHSCCEDDQEEGTVELREAEVDIAFGLKVGLAVVTGFSLDAKREKATAEPSDDCACPDHVPKKLLALVYHFRQLVIPSDPKPFRVSLLVLFCCLKKSL